MKPFIALLDLCCASMKIQLAAAATAAAAAAAAVANDTLTLSCFNVAIQSLPNALTIKMKKLHTTPNPPLMHYHYKIKKLHTTPKPQLSQVSINL